MVFVPADENALNLDQSVTKSVNESFLRENRFPMRVQPLTADAAETIAVQALGWIVGREDLFGIFLGSSGAGVDDVRVGASDPDFLGFVLDYLLSREDDLLAFCMDAGIPPDLPARARAALPGGALPNWT